MELIQPDQLELAAAAIATGKLVVLPTRRWYMLCANARSSEACGRIFAAKKRPLTKSLALVVPSLTAARKLFQLNNQAERLAASFWPGDLAIILPWRDHMIGEEHAAVGSPNALVVSESGILGRLAELSSCPVAATTVNIAGGARSAGPGPAITLSEVRAFATGSRLDIAFGVDGGICPAANHLTIVDCSTAVARIVRPGIVHERAIIAALTPSSE